MRFYTPAQAQDYLGLHLPLERLGRQQARDQGFSMLYFCLSDVNVSLMRLATDALVDVVAPWEEAFLWIDAPLRWNREALHLYYRVRRSYGDHRLVFEAPVHYYLEYEAADLLSFVQIGLLNSWRMHIRTRQDYGRVCVSADGDVELMARDGDHLQKIFDRLTKARIETVAEDGHKDGASPRGSA